MVGIYGYALLLLHIIDTFQDGEPMTDAHNAHLFQFFMPQRDQGLADNLIFCEKWRLASTPEHRPLRNWPKLSCPALSPPITYLRRYRNTAITPGLIYSRHIDRRSSGQWCYQARVCPNPYDDRRRLGSVQLKAGRYRWANSHHR